MKSTCGHNLISTATRESSYPRSVIWQEQLIISNRPPVCRNSAIDNDEDKDDHDFGRVVLMVCRSVFGAWVPTLTNGGLLFLGERCCKENGHRKPKYFGSFTESDLSRAGTNTSDVSFSGTDWDHSSLFTWSFVWASIMILSLLGLSCDTF